MLERKIINIFTYTFEPDVAITYTVGSEQQVDNLQFWIKEDLKYNYAILRRVLEIMGELEKIGKGKIIEKDIFRNYQKSFDVTFVNANYKITVEQFRTERMINILKPYRNFVRLTKESINIFIKNYIEKGELK